jgi:hypothetical protein
MSKTHYEVLGINPLAGGAKIKRHYYELCKKYHPDISDGDPQKMVAINEAYRILSDSTLKSAYDRELAAQRREAAFAQAAQTATARQSTWQDVAPQPVTPEPTHVTRAAQTAETKKKSGWAWFMTFGSVIALAVIAMSYVMPIPQAANATTQTPAVATNDTTTETQTSTTSPNPASDKAAQDALNTLQSDTTPPPSVAPSPTSSSTGADSGTSSTNTNQPTTRKHRHPVSFWYTQSND